MNKSFIITGIKKAVGDAKKWKNADPYWNNPTICFSAITGEVWCDCNKLDEFEVYRDCCQVYDLGLVARYSGMEVRTPLSMQDCRRLARYVMDHKDDWEFKWYALA